MADLVRELGPKWLGDFLPAQRWFGDKTRRLTAVSVEEVTVDQIGDEYHAFLIAAVTFEQGPPSRYFVPLAIMPEEKRDSSPAPVFATVAWTSGDYRVQDAFLSSTFRDRLVADVAAQTSIPAARGRLVWNSTPEAALIFGRQNQQPNHGFPESRLLSGEQSNTAIVYGNKVFLKVFRKLQAGINPDLEVGRFLTTRTSFRHFPTLLAEFVYQSNDGTSIALGMVQAFSPSLGDAWSIILHRLQEAVATAGTNGTTGERDGSDALVDAARLLGQRTGQLHVALASVQDDAAFAPEPIAADDVERWSDRLRSDLNQVLSELNTQSERLLPLAVERLVTGAIAASVAPRLHGFAALVGEEKTRVHGDYHLGQVLWTPSGDFVILDFEGEPARSLDERRLKTSPLKDVAGMLRSFAYAGAATRLLDPESFPFAVPTTRRWEQQARAAFLTGYQEETVAKGARFVPADPERFARALDAWELDKIVYEVHYELNNRPGWLHLPLEALRQRPTV